MRILFSVGTLYPSQQGGPSNTIYWLAKALCAKGIAVTNITSDIDINGRVPLDVWLQTSYGRTRYCRDLVHMFPISFLIHSWIEVPRHDVVHINSLFYFPSFVVACLARFAKKPIVWSVRGNLDPAAMRSGRWKKWPMLFLIRFLFSGSKALFHATSEAEYHLLLKHFRDARLTLVPNYMVIPPCAPREQNAQRYFLYVGRLHPIKALERLFDGLAMSARFMNCNTMLVIAGTGDNEYVDHLRAKISKLGIADRVVFIGQVEGNIKELLFANAYFSILPSFAENFGNVVIESLAQGTPVIASKGTPWAILEGEEAGFWTENTPAELATSINRALSLEDEQYQAYRVNALNLVRRKFDVDRQIDTWIGIYQNEAAFRS